MFVIIIQSRFADTGNLGVFRQHDDFLALDIYFAGVCRVVRMRSDGAVYVREAFGHLQHLREFRDFRADGQKMPDTRRFRTADDFRQPFVREIGVIEMAMAVDKHLGGFLFNRRFIPREHALRRGQRRTGLQRMGRADITELARIRRHRNLI